MFLSFWCSILAKLLVKISLIFNEYGHSKIFQLLFLGIIQIYQFMATGNAELGLIALSQYQVTEKKLKGSHWRVPQAL